MIFKLIIIENVYLLAAIWTLIDWFSIYKKEGDGL